jgi:hypothetical protein
MHRPDVPTAVVISEAVELAKSYSTDDSSRYVNGVLSADYLDAPATTSATIYKVQFCNSSATSSVSVQPNSNRSTLTLLEIGA